MTGERDEPRDRKVTTYLTQTEKDRLAREADDRGISLSSRVAQIIETERAAATRDDVLRQTDAEAWLESMTDGARTALLEISEGVENRSEATRERADHAADMAARSGTYSVVNFHVLKRLFREHPELSPLPESWISEKFSDASGRLREDDPSPSTPDRDDSRGESEGDSTPRAVDSHEAEPYHDDDESENRTGTEDLY